MHDALMCIRMYAPYHGPIALEIGGDILELLNQTELLIDARRLLRRELHDFLCSFGSAELAVELLGAPARIEAELLELLVRGGEALPHLLIEAARFDELDGAAPGGFDAAARGFDEAGGEVVEASAIGAGVRDEDGPDPPAAAAAAAAAPGKELEGDGSKGKGSRRRGGRAAELPRLDAAPRSVLQGQQGRGPAGSSSSSCGDGR
jgi:hypothetical protein